MEERLRMLCRRAAARLREAEALVFSAGAGMGVDSGLPDFRGNEGFWNAYPPYRKLGISFVSAANPDHFRRDPAFGWGFYGHRAGLYRSTIPHEGFRLLRELAAHLGVPAFVVTSNVDGHFQKAGFLEDAVWEVHGSIHYLQCLEPCGEEIWRNTEEVRVDPETMRASFIPRCPYCGGVARPNILMFGDFSWISRRIDLQEERFRAFIAGISRVAVVEAGAGTAIPTIRSIGERLAARGGTLVRINPWEPEGPSGCFSFPCGALEAIRSIAEEIGIC